MNILFINGSPNKNGNTAALAAELLAGKDYKTLMLTDYTIGSYGQQLAGDGLADVIAEMKKADVIVVGSPVYWHNICGSVRNVLDRFYGAVDEGELAGRKLYFVFQGGAPEKWMLEAGEYTMKRFAALYGMNYGGMVTTRREAAALGKHLESIFKFKEELIMKYAQLNNGVKMPMEGVGTFLMSPDEAEASALSALQSGYRLIDTANAYVNEKAVGRAMKKSGVPREEIFLETKLWPSFYEQDDAVDKTLQRLNTDYIDLLLIHQPAGNYVAGYRLMEKAYKEGKVRAIGLSNFKKEQIEEILSLCEVKPTILQTELHPYNQEPDLKAFLSKNGMAAQAWYPLGHGDRALREEPLFAKLGEKYGKTSTQIILRWHIQAGNVVIPGSKNPEHIKSNFDLFDFELTADEMAQIAAMNQNKRYYTSTPELLKKYAEMVPPVDKQK